jgi:Protein of unknown function (DUF3313)
MLRIHVALLIALAGLSSACASTEQVSNVELFDFLNDSHSVPQIEPERQVSQGHRHPIVDWSAYNKILLQPVTIREDLLSKLRDQERQHLLLLAGSFEDRLHLKLSRDYDMVERPMAATMLIQVAITRSEEWSTVPTLWSNLAQQLRAVAAIYTFAGRPPFAGEVTAEFTIRDAQTGELLAAGINRRVGRQDRFVDGKVLNVWSNVKSSLEFWADLSTYRLCVLRGGSGCVEPQIHSVNPTQHRS